jgi:hypothetical protein
MPASYDTTTVPTASPSSFNFDLGNGKGAQKLTLDQVKNLPAKDAQQLQGFLQGNDLSSEPGLKQFSDAVNNRVTDTAAASGINKQLQNRVNGLTPTDSTPGIELNQGIDYVDRRAMVDQNNAIKKVALVGSYGTGARPLTGDVATGGTIQNQAKDQQIVVFDVTPELNESGTTVLVDIGDIRAAASIVIYMGSPSRNFSITAKFVSRDATEATQTYKNIVNLKAWREPQLAPGVGFNAEPETLRLFAYEGTLKGIPVMIQSLNITWPSEVDYINDNSGNPVPIIQDVSIQLKEVRSFDDLKTFDYSQFRIGKLNTW